MRLPTAAVLRFFCRFTAIHDHFSRDRTAGTANVTADTAKKRLNRQDAKIAKGHSNRK
jgi:hypothetical protein